MTEPTDSRVPVAVADPGARDQLAALTEAVIVIETGRAIAVETGHLGTDRGAWRAFLSEAVGGDPDMVHMFGDLGRAYYCNSDVFHAARHEYFNPIATMMLADDDGVPLRRARAVYGTVVVTGFDVEACAPRPLTRQQLLGACDTLARGNHFAQAVARHLGAASASGPQL